jgi:hypothetical protein
VTLSGCSYTSTFYLNRYFNFRALGRALIDWELTIPFKQEENSTVTRDFKGSFPIEVASASEPELRADLAHFSGALRSSDPVTRKEAAEALTFLDTPISVEYTTPMLSIEGLEIAGIHALARFPSQETYGLIIEMPLAQRLDRGGRRPRRDHSIEYPHSENRSPTALEVTKL